MRTFLKIKLLFLFLFLFLFQNSKSQIQGDTLNRYNSKHKKQGYWTFYFDSLFNLCNVKKAKYYGYTIYDNGASRIRPIPRGGDRDKIIYKPFVDSLSKFPVLLNGEIYSYNHTDSLHPILYDSYRQGNTFFSIEYFNHSSFIESDEYYFDSIYKDQPASYLFYKKENGLHKDSV